MRATGNSGNEAGRDDDLLERTRLQLEVSPGVVPGRRARSSRAPLVLRSPRLLSPTDVLFWLFKRKVLNFKVRCLKLTKETTPTF